ncbi:MAG: lamin tail domain-containing protein [Candidatus Paceibacterota bacterium]|nr:MAG: lamin tail domain-containing protein [Candidatus Paceibacterota bacterium]
MGRYPVLMVGVSGIAIVLGGMWSSRQNAVPTDGTAFLFQEAVGDTSSPRVSPTVTPTPRLVTPTPPLVTPLVSPKTTVTPTVTPISTPSVTPTQKTQYITPTITSSPRVSPTVTLTPRLVTPTPPLVTPKTSVTPTVTPISTPSVTPTLSVTPEPTPSRERVFISEIAWAGTRHSASDEWIELGNDGDSPVSLEGWRLRSDDGSPDIALSGTIPARGTFLIERTVDDNALPDVVADLATSFGRGGIKNNGERIVLIGPDGSEKDAVDCSSGWFAGNAATYASMERISGALDGSQGSSWRTYSGPGQGLDGGGNPVLGSPKMR